jgi:hypothetical protein
MAWLRISLTVAAIALLALPAGAAARTRHFVLPGTLSFEAQLPKSRGFSLRLSASSRGEVQLIGRKGRVTLLYAAKGSVTGNRIRAGFGRFGAVDLRFAGGEPKPAGDTAGCRGKAPVKSSGALSGTIRLHGKRGSFTVAERHVRATRRRTYRLVCGQGGGGGGSTIGVGYPRPRPEAEPEEQEVTADVLEAGARLGRRRARFQAINLTGLPFHLAAASVSERVGPVRVDEIAAIETQKPAVVFSPEGTDPETVTAALPSPFAGAATYRHAAGSPATWAGSLRVRLPGSGSVPLTGAAFRARVCHISLVDAFEGCPRR